MAELALFGGNPVRTRKYPAWPVHDAGEVEAARRVIESGQWGSKGGGEVGAFSEAFAAYHGAKHGVCTNAGTTAIRIALQALGLKMGDEVIVPAYTFIASASPVLDLGAIPVFVDVDPETYNIDPGAVEAAITDRTVGILPVHFGGLPADMDSLAAVATKHSLWIMEDAAQAWGARWNNVGVGHIGQVGAFSFQASKNITAGEGGIALTDSDEIEELLSSFSNTGRRRDGIAWKHYRLGGNYRMSEIHAAILRVQLHRYPSLLAKRDKNATYLSKRLAERPGIKPRFRPPQATAHAWHLFIWRYDADEFGGIPRGRFIEAMQKEGIPVYAGYTIPLFRQPVFEEKNFDPAHPAQKVDFTAIYCPATEKACADEALWLTQSILLGEKEDMDDVVAAVEKVRASIDALRKKSA